MADSNARSSKKGASKKGAQPEAATNGTKHRAAMGKQTRLGHALNNMLHLLKLVAENDTEASRVAASFEEVSEVAEARAALRDAGFDGKPPLAVVVRKIQDDIKAVDVTAEDAPEKLEKLTAQLRAAQRGQYPKDA